MKIFDLSHPIHPGMPVYPGTEPPIFEVGSSLEEDGFLEKRITLFSHTGTHLDAPAHILPGGRALDSFPIDHFQGPGCVVDAREPADGVVSLDDLQAHEAAIRASDFVLLRSGWDALWGRAGYFEGFPVLAEDAALWLSRQDLKGIGVDMISVDAVGSVAMPVHQALLGAGLILIENLRGLEQLPSHGFVFACYPLRITEADGSPTRAVATIDPAPTALLD